MKKQQLMAMALSAISAGILISCTKPNDTADGVEEVAQQPTSTDSTASNTASQDEVTDVPVNLDSKVIGADVIHLSTEQSQDYLNHVIETHILPAYSNVSTQSDKLTKLADEYCQSGTLSGEKLQALRTQWLETAKAWATAQAINFGPATDSMSDLYINYYPDERGMVHQGVIDLIKTYPNLTPEQLASESAIVQGIPGLEEVLYANDTLDSAQCRYVVSASSALNQRLKDIDTAWQDAPQELLGINEQGAGASSVNLGMNRWINSLLSLVETTKSVSLDKPLGLTGHKKGHLPADSAEQSRAIITAKVEALNKAFTDPALVTLLNENNHSELSDKLNTVLTQLTTRLEQMPADIGKASADEQQALYDELTTLTQLIKRELMPILGVQVGFNSTDGD